MRGLSAQTAVGDLQMRFPPKQPETIGFSALILIVGWPQAGDRQWRNGKMGLMSFCTFTQKIAFPTGGYKERNEAYPVTLIRLVCLNFIF